MKRFSAFALALIMALFCFAGCKDKDADETKDEKPSTKFTVVVKGEFFDATGMTSDELKEDMAGYDKDVIMTENEDDTVSYNLEFDLYEKFCDDYLAEQKKTLDAIEDKNDLVEDIEYSEGLKTINVKVDASDYKKAKKTDVSALTDELSNYSLSYQYLMFTMSSSASVTINYADDDTDKVLDTVTK